MTDLGPKASILLGMLGYPMTTGELHRLVRRSLRRYDDADGKEALADLDAGGKTEIWKQLVKLEDEGLVTRAAINPNEPHMWWRV